MHGKDRFKRLVTAVMLCLSAIPAAQATDRVDVFSVSTPHSSGPAAKPAAQVKVPAQTMPTLPRPRVSIASNPDEWFFALDTYVGALKPSKADRAIMAQPFNSEVERINEFCSTTARLARNYRLLAKKLTELPNPRSVPEAKQLKDLTINWYNDSALLYEDMIRPRRPCRTKEELAAVMKDLSDRSEGLKTSFLTLEEMDIDIRKHYGVRRALHEDTLQQYYTSPTQ